MNPEARRSSDRPQVKPYEAPQVRDLGTLVELTRKNIGPDDGQPGGQHPMSH
jgi:hypothetical protein